MANLKDVLDFIRNPQLDASDRSLIVEALNSQVRMKRAQAKAGFRPGQQVTFYSTRSFKTVTGTIRKINRVNIDLIENGTGIRWRVSPQLLKAV